MAAAYLKIWVKVGSEKEVRDALRAVRGMVRADLTTGEQDVVALVEAADYQSLLDTILGAVRGIQGIERTVTNLVLE